MCFQHISIGKSKWNKINNTRTHFAAEQFHRRHLSCAHITTETKADVFMGISIEQILHYIYYCCWCDWVGVCERINSGKCRIHKFILVHSNGCHGAVDGTLDRTTEHHWNHLNIHCRKLWLSLSILPSDYSPICSIAFTQRNGMNSSILFIALHHYSRAQNCVPSASSVANGE